MFVKMIGFEMNVNLAKSKITQIEKASNIVLSFKKCKRHTSKFRCTNNIVKFRIFCNENYP